MKSCDRKGCESMSVYRYSNAHGYICDNCFEELVARGPESNISEFMNDEKTLNREDESRARFNVAFPVERDTY